MAFIYSSLFFISSLFTICKSANVLYVVPFTSTSHYIMLRPIGLELARRGHNVTVITAVKEKNPPDNYHEIVIGDIKIWDVIKGGRPNVFTMASISSEKFYDKILWSGSLAFMEVVLNSTAFQTFLSIDQKFDLVISEQFFQEATYILAHKYNAPLVLVTTFGNCMHHNIATRNPLQLPTVIPEFFKIEDPFSFWGRLKNVYATLYEFFWWKYWFLEKQEELVKKYLKDLPKPVPSLYEMQKNAALILINSHFSIETPTAYLPNIVEIGGIHLTENNGALPKDLQNILDKAIDGVVYFNFGSNVKSSELPTEKKNAFLNVFRRLNKTVLWKWEDENFDNKPANIVTRRWFPQKEILAHPNVEVFISHGGLIGTQESIFNAIPMIGVPIYADQYNNMLQIEEKGMGKILNYQDINEENFDSILHDVLNNDGYKKNAVEISRRFKDRPMTPVDTAMFWIEYVLRNNNADNIKNPAIYLDWVTYSMIDVYVFITLILVMFVYLVIIFINNLKIILSKQQIKIKMK